MKKIHDNDNDNNTMINDQVVFSFFFLINVVKPEANGKSSASPASRKALLRASELGGTAGLLTENENGCPTQQVVIPTIFADLLSHLLRWIFVSLIFFNLECHV